MSPGEEQGISDPLVSVSIKLRVSQREKMKDVNLSEKVREWIDEYLVSLSEHHNGL